MLLCYEVTRDLPLQMDRDRDAARHDEIAGAVRQETRAGADRARRHGLSRRHARASLPSARVAHIGLYRDPRTLVAVEYFFKAPDDMAERLVLVLHPMLATGNSAVAAVDRLKESGAKSIRIVCLLACPQGIEKVPRASSRRAYLDRGDRRGIRASRAISFPASAMSATACTARSEVTALLALEHDLLRAFPQDELSERQILQAIGDGQEVIACERAHLAGKCNCTIGEQDFGFADAAGIEDNLDPAPDSSCAFSKPSPRSRSPSGIQQASPLQRTWMMRSR